MQLYLTLIFGLIIATFRILAELFATESSSLIYQFATINFSHMAIFMFITSVLVCITVSMATNPPNLLKIRGLAFGNLSAQDKIDSKDSFDKIDLVASIILAPIIVCILIYFSIKISIRMQILGIDLGSSSIKVAVFDNSKQKTLARAFFRKDYLLKCPTLIGQNNIPDVWWNSLKEPCKRSKIK